MWRKLCAKWRLDTESLQDLNRKGSSKSYRNLVALRVGQGALIDVISKLCGETEIRI